jgi:hypothetical protein
MTTIAAAPARSDADKLTILKLLAAGRDADFVAQAMSMARDDVVLVASAHGYPDVTKLAWAADVVGKAIDDDARAAIPAGRPGLTGTRPAQPLVVGPARPDPVAQLLADAASSSRKRTRDLGQRAAKALELVRAELRTERERDAVTAARREAEAKVRAEVQRLERRLAELKKGLGHSAAVPGGAAAVGLDPKAVRAWAREHDVPCTSTGRVPRAVVDAYLAAHPGSPS